MRFLNDFLSNKHSSRKETISTSLKERQLKVPRNYVTELRGCKLLTNCAHLISEFILTNRLNNNGSVFTIACFRGSIVIGALADIFMAKLFHCPRRSRSFLTIQITPSFLRTPSQASQEYTKKKKQKILRWRFNSLLRMCNVCHHPRRRTAVQWIFRHVGILAY